MVHREPIVVATAARAHRTVLTERRLPVYAASTVFFPWIARARARSGFVASASLPVPHELEPHATFFRSFMKIVIVGAGGRLGSALVREYRERFDVTGVTRAHLDLSNLDEMREKLRAKNFDVLINAAAFTNVDLCETQRDQAFLINAEAPRVLAEICGDKNAKLIHFSTDYVFDGEKRKPYTEEDEAKPISVYGDSKLAGEKNVLAAQGGHLIVRVSWVFGPDRPSFIDAMIKRAREEEYIEAIADKFSTPTYTLDIAEMLPRFFNGNVEG